MRKPTRGRADVAEMPRGVDDEGGVDLSACPDRPGRCGCPACEVCGWGEHYAIHAHGYGAEPGSKPVGHRYRPAGPG